MSFIHAKDLSCCKARKSLRAPRAEGRALRAPVVGCIPEMSASNEQSDVLAAMLRIAESEIHGKDEQIELLHEMVATNEQEIKKKDARIEELEGQLGAMKAEVGRFKELFYTYLQRAEAARQSSAFSRAASNGLSTSEGNPLNSFGLPPPSAAALIDSGLTASLAALPPSSSSPKASSRASAGSSDCAGSPPTKPSSGRDLTDDEIVPSAPLEDTPYSPILQAAER